MRALDLAQAAVNMVGFAQGWGVTVLLDKLIKPDGTETDIFVNDPKVAPLCTAYRLNDPTANPAFDQVWLMVSSEPPLFMAFDDLIAAITLPHQAPINCARALEGIRNMIAPGLPRKTGWPQVQEQLKCSEAYLRFITQYSTAPRHGDRTFIPGDITAEIVKRAWTVMNRFLEFRKRGNHPLPESEFPVLS